MGVSRFFFACVLMMSTSTAAMGQLVPEAEKYRISTGYYDTPPAEQPSAPRGPIPLPSAYAAFAMDWSTTDLFWTTFANSYEEASAASLDACRKAGGKDCRNLDGFANQCSAVAIDGDGYVHQGMDVMIDRAEQLAMNDCNAAGRAGLCRLKTTAVCATYSPVDGSTRLSQSVNQTAATASDELLEERSRKYDTREYWGAIVEARNQIFSIVNQPTRKMALDRLAEKCPGGACNQLVVWSNACAARANAVDEKGEPVLPMYGVTGETPELAYENSLKVCTEKSRMRCLAGGVECSGRAFVGYEWKGTR